MTPKIDKNDEISTFREFGQNFGKVLSGELKLNFFGPAGGSGRKWNLRFWGKCFCFVLKNIGMFVKYKFESEDCLNGKEIKFQKLSIIFEKTIASKLINISLV